jgi:crotonobetainyl-CoA:carnitine CoA-transferase CaiB-like acyl-CoA transferase
MNMAQSLPDGAQRPPAGILANVRILDLTRVVAGPWCTQTLADLGADVLKIERPGEGDDTRKVGPFVTGADGHPTQDSAFFMGSNRGKRSVTVDIASPEGAALVRELALQCDVFIENYKVGALQKYGLDAAHIRALNPRIIYCSVTGFGQDGPYAPRPAYDSVMQAMCGLMSTCGHPDGEPGAGPMRSAVPIADIFTGLYAAIGILAALMQRGQTGQGQVIDAAMVDVTTAINAHLALGYLMTGQVPQRQGNNNPITAPSEVFRASDGYFSMSAANTGQFASLLQALELDPAIDQDPRFANGMARIQHRRALHEILEARTIQQSVRHWIDRLSPLNVPCAPIYDMQQLFDDPHVRHRGLAMRLPHASGVEVPVLRSPLHLSDAPVQHRAPPMLGQHTDEVLQQRLGKSAAEIAVLRERGVV